MEPETVSGNAGIASSAPVPTAAASRRGSAACSRPTPRPRGSSTRATPSAVSQTSTKLRPVVPNQALRYANGDVDWLNDTVAQLNPPYGHVPATTSRVVHVAAIRGGTTTRRPNA